MTWVCSDKSQVKLCLSTTNFKHQQGLVMFVISEDNINHPKVKKHYLVPELNNYGGIRHSEMNCLQNIVQIVYSLCWLIFILLSEADSLFCDVYFIIPLYNFLLTLIRSAANTFP